MDQAVSRVVTYVQVVREAWQTLCGRADLQGFKRPAATGLRPTDGLEVEFAYQIDKLTEQMRVA